MKMCVKFLMHGLFFPFRLSRLLNVGGGGVVSH